MTVELGHFALVLALIVAAVQGSLPMLGASRGRLDWMDVATTAALTQLLLVAVAFGCLMFAYLTSDFSVLNVASNSHSTKPLLYKVSGTWGNHEGSMLLWVLILAVFGAALAAFGRNLPPSLKARALAVQAWIAFGFYLFILFTSNPFARLMPPPADGQGLNPLLQDPGLAFHPPFLYLGYVGFSMAFSFAIAALIEGRVDAAWARWVRPWTLAAWVFLTIGIGLGSWWAYYELGWGGWWFWDPVENASLLPWLAGTALLHSAIVVEKRDTLKAWTIFLAILTFSLSLLGTFLVRSGVLTSVHAFASDPTRGIFILLLMVLVVGGSLALFAWRGPSLKGGGLFQPISREGSLLLNNLLLGTATATVLLGTLYPLLMEALDAGKVSVGKPFFNATFVPLMTPLVIVMVVGPLLPWKRGDLAGALKRLWLAAAVALAVFGVAWLVTDPRSATGAFGLGLAAWLLIGTLAELAGRIALFGAPLGDSLRRLRRLPRAAIGMTLAHGGLALLIAGITASSVWKQENILVMKPGETTTAIGGYHITFEGAGTTRTSNYTALQGHLVAHAGDREVARFRPERRYYPVEGSDTTEAAIVPRPLGDLYVVIGEPQSSGGYVIRLYFEPLVHWIWIGVLVMAFGGLVSLSDRRLRVGAPAQRAAAVTPRSPPVTTTTATAAVVRRLPYVLPLVIFAAIAVYFWVGLGRDPHAIPSMLIGKPVPELDLPPIKGAEHGLSTADLAGHVSLVNVFGSWCVACREEHPLLMQLSRQGVVPIYGIDWRERSAEAGPDWLAKHGNPYRFVGDDPDSKAAIAFGVSGAPETFVIDKRGIVRHRHVGPITPQVWEQELWPLVRALQAE